LLQGLSLEEVSHVIALATAPAFLLGGVITFLTLLVGRMARVIDRARALHEIDEQDEKRAHLKADMPLLRRRARLIHFSMWLSIGSGIATALLIVVAFLGALFNVTLEATITTLFVLALALFMAALAVLAREAIMTLHEFRHYL
jgi:amino acid transporter